MGASAVGECLAVVEAQTRCSKFLFKGVRDPSACRWPPDGFVDNARIPSKKSDIVSDVPTVTS